MKELTKEDRHNIYVRAYEICKQSNYDWLSFMCNSIAVSWIEYENGQSLEGLEDLDINIPSDIPSDILDFYTDQVFNVFPEFAACKPAGGHYKDPWWGLSETTQRMIVFEKIIEETRSE